MNKRKWTGAFLVVGLLSLPLASRMFGQDAGKPMQSQAAAPREVRSSILASGNLSYQDQVSLSPEVIAKVTAILVAEGDTVRQGQLVLRLDEEVFRAEVAQQEAHVRSQKILIERQELQVRSEERQWRRMVSLHERRLIDERKFDEASHALDLARVELRASRENLQQAEAQLRQARERLAKTEIRAPMSGTVISLDIKLGETAVASTTGIAGSSLMTIADTGSLITEVNVDEADISKVQTGQEVAVFSAAYPDQRIAGQVRKIPLSPKKADPRLMATGGGSLARNYTVQVQIEAQAGLLLRPGMTCRAEIYTASSGQRLAVPVQAVFSEEAAAKAGDNAGHFVYVRRSGRAEKRRVQLGLADDNFQEILAGLKPGDAVLTGPYQQLRQLKDGERLSDEHAG